MKLLYLGNFDDLRNLKEKKGERKGDRCIGPENRDNVLQDSQITKTFLQ